MPSLRKWAADTKVLSSPANMAVEQCLDSIKEYFECSICRDNLDRPIQTKCGHVFCSKCLQDLSKEPNATCPLCKVKISNRSLVVREDVTDMMNIVARLSEAFTSELERYFDWKVTPRKESSVSGASSTGGAAKKVNGAPKAGTSSKTTLAEQMVIKDKARTESDSVDRSDEVVVEDEHERSGKNKRIKAIRKNNIDRTSVESDDQEQEKRVSTGESRSPAWEQNPSVDAAVESGDTKSKKSAEVISGLQSSETSSIRSKETAGSSSSSGLAQDDRSKELTRVTTLEKMRKQTYVIMDSGIETVPAKNKSQSPGKPLDLSLSRRRSTQFTEYVYTEKPTTIRFVKPLDLSIKKEKRKLEDVHAPTVMNMVSIKPIQPVQSSTKLDCYAAPPQSPQRKKGKFEDNCVRSKQKAPQASTLSRSTSKRFSVEVDFETRPEDDDDDVPNDDNNGPVFTPTPPPVQNVYVSKKKETTQKVNSAKKTVRPSQFNIESQVMKDFDFPFDEDEMETGNPSSGGRVTSSDELLCNITEESVLRGVKGRSQAKSGQSPGGAAKRIEDKEQFVFKQPSGLITQGSKKKSKDVQTKKDDVFMECDDDDFQQPRDSDFMFLDLTCGGGSGSDKGGGDRINKSNSNDLSPSSEKENSDKRPSLSRSGSRRTTQVKSTPSTVNEKALSLTSEDTDLKKNQMLKPSNDPVEAFEDDDDEEWLLDIPMEGESRSSGKRMSGKSKQSEEDKTKEVAEIAPSLAVPLKSQKQRYVFCPTRLTKQQTLKLQQLCKMCDGVITKDFSPDVTHLIINLVAGRVPQTLKYLLAIAGRKWVVIYDWVEECVNAGELVSEDQFETSNYKQCDPGVRRSRLAKRNLFDGFKFYFATEHYKTMGFTTEEVSKLMETLGGSVVDAPKDMYRDLIIIGSKNGNSTDYNHWLNTNKWATVTFEWVIGCILEYRLKPFDATFLCIDVTTVKSINAPKTFQTAFSQYVTEVSQAMSPA